MTAWVSLVMEQRNGRDGTGTGTMAWWNNGTSTMAQARWMDLAQAHWYRHDGTAAGTRNIAGAQCCRHDSTGTMHKNDGIGTMAWAWHML